MEQSIVPTRRGFEVEPVLAVLRFGAVCRRMFATPVLPGLHQCLCDSRLKQQRLQLKIALQGLKGLQLLKNLNKPVIVPGATGAVRIHFNEAQTSGGPKGVEPGNRTVVGGFRFQMHQIADPVVKAAKMLGFPFSIGGHMVTGLDQ